MIRTSKLSLSFNTKPLEAELQLILPDEWIRHFNHDYFEGQWDGVPLRSPGGMAHQIYPDPHAHGEVIDTVFLGRCPNLRHVVESFHCRIRSARLLRLTPGSIIREHRDDNLAFEDGEARLHIPITSNTGVEFFLDGEQVELQPGECWYLNFSLAHKVVNRGHTDRVHLVIDCVVNEWLKGQILRNASETEELPVRVTTPLGGWPEFREEVLKDLSLQVRLREIEDRQTFVRLAVRLGAEKGFCFSADDVESAMRDGRRVWIERWIG